MPLVFLAVSSAYSNEEGRHHCQIRSREDVAEQPCDRLWRPTQAIGYGRVVGRQGLIGERCEMLELRPNCECCDKDLPPAVTDAMICTFECTFCRECVEGKLAGVCPNCGGNFAPRPIRPNALLAKFPPSSKRVLKPQGCGQAENSTAA
jgi:uncharacterized protein